MEKPSETIAETETPQTPVDAAASPDAVEPPPEVVPEDTAPVAAAGPAPRRRGGFFPALLGGAIAAGLGAGATLYLLPQGWQPSADSVAQALALKDQAARIQALSAQVAALQAVPRPDLEPLAAGLAAAATAQADLGRRIDTVEGRLTVIENQPPAGGGAPIALIEGFRSELTDLRRQLDEQRNVQAGTREEIAAAAAAAEQRIAAAEAEAARLKAEAEEAARQGRARAGLSRLMAALDSGAPLDPALSDLTAAGVQIPPELAVQAAGVPTLAALQAGFADPARVALAAALRVTQGTGAWDRFTAFLRVQTGARSLTPQAGGDPDAILSRAEAALRKGDLPAALAELAGLPPEGQAALTGWQAQVQARLAATGAAAALAGAIEQGGGQ